MKAPPGIAPWRSLLAALLLLAACSDRQRRNPLDPLATAPLDLVDELRAQAGDGQVELSWDYSRFDDVEGYRLYRRRAGGEFAPLTAEALGAAVRRYVDEDVANGVVYEYRMGLLVRGEGERPVGAVERATPGPEVAWVADRGSGLVWKINADGRSARFARGRFSDLRDLAVDAGDGTCWVSDGASPALYRIAADGELQRLGAALRQPDELEIDALAGIGWVSDSQRREVFWFSLAARDSLEFFVVDASLAEPSGLAAIAGSCWVVDRLQGRAFLYSTSGRRLAEFRSLDRPGFAAADADGSAWVLVGDGAGMVRLGAHGEFREVDFPFAGALSLAVDGRRGEVWVVGARDMARYARDGALIQRWSDLSQGRAMAYDPLQGNAWMATAATLWKFAGTGETLARLEGFSSLARIAVDAGRRR